MGKLSREKKIHPNYSIKPLQMQIVTSSKIDYNYRLVTDIDCDGVLSPSPSKSDPTDLDEIRVHIVSASRLPQVCTNVTFANISSASSVTEDDELGDGLRTGPSSLLTYKLSQQPPPTDSGPSSIQTEVSQTSTAGLERTSSLPWLTGERRRRKLPEIPKNKKCELIHDELNEQMCA